jgi:acetyl-CoA carboxylase, biotin carboxylase subunit
MKEKVLIPHRGIVALDIIHSLNSIGLETVLMHSPEDALTLPVKLADRSYKFYSSRLEDSYLDMEAIVEKAVEIKAQHIHPGYGFLAENPDFAALCRRHDLHFIGPDEKVLRLVEDKLRLRQLADELGLRTMPNSGLIKSPLDFDCCRDVRFPIILKPLKGQGGRGIRVADFRRDAEEQIGVLLKRDENVRNGIFFEEYRPHGHHIEIPFFRDCQGNLLLLPEIESSIQRRFQKVFQESPSPNLDNRLRESLCHDATQLLSRLDYVGLGYIEFIIENGTSYFLEINPTFQINTMISEVQQASNFLKKQFAISRGERLHHVSGVEVIKPSHHVLLISVMAENPFNGFQPSVGVVTDFFHYSTIRNIFKTPLYTGARLSPMYDPFIGKVLTFAVERKNAIADMRKFLDNIIVRGVRTNLIFLKHLLENEYLQRGETVIDFLHLKYDFAARRRSEDEVQVAAALLAAAFHIDNRRQNYKARLEKMKQPGFFKRLFGGM